MAKKGRPSAYTQAVAGEICERIADGQTLMAICEDEHMPSRRTVNRWLLDEAHADFLSQYARARELQADYWADEQIEIADDARNDWMEKKNKDGSTYTAVDMEHIQRSRLRLETRRWLQERLNPKRYGQKVELGGPDGGPIKVEFVA